MEAAEETMGHTSGNDQEAIRKEILEEAEDRKK